MRTTVTLILSLFLQNNAYADLDYRMVGKVDLSNHQYISVLKDRAIYICEINAKDYNFEKRKCEKYVNDRSDSCVGENKYSLPESVTNKESAKKFSLDYLLCVTPAPRVKLN
ncbi:hypothetical protein [uncultured Microbulbifer sp.]|uniref:hypothetical protein n=1 Tax=uncultured Microbulbifer sp. TaxID=348147 RepID=UPI002639BF75|nr:hypothetical protein [uncultured Microbulbifer sp.]